MRSSQNPGCNIVPCYFHRVLFWGTWKIWTFPWKWSRIWWDAIILFPYQPVFPWLGCHPTVQPAPSWTVNALILLKLLSRYGKLVFSWIWTGTSSKSLTTRKYLRFPILNNMCQGPCIYQLLSRIWMERKTNYRLRKGICHCSLPLDSSFLPWV